MKNLPVYKLKIPEAEGFLTEIIISLVDFPAIKMGWEKFSDQQRFQFTADKEKQLIMGALLVADMPIYRKMDDQEFYVVFEKADIFKIAENFFKHGGVHKFNAMHKPGEKIDGVYVVESMLVDEARGVHPPDAFKGISDGSWIITAKIDNKDFWDQYIRTGMLAGFSIESLFQYEKIIEEDEAVLERISQIVRGDA